MLTTRASHKTLQLIIGLFVSFFLTMAGAYAAQAQVKTIVETTPASQTARTGTLGTKAYEPTEKEKAFFQKLEPKEQTTGSMFEDYSITGKAGKYIGWFGIVRKVEEDKTAGETKLLVEMKYFDGLTDLHIMALSFNGAGDFTAILSGTGLGIKYLSLVKVYGTVERETNSVPEVKADYVRQWDWGAFTFLMAYGKQKGNKQWKKLNKVNEERIYNPYPTNKYYEERLGTRQP